MMPLIGMNLTRPQLVAASKFHPQVMQQLEGVVNKLKNAAPIAEKSGVKLAVENHTDAFSEEVIWVLDQVNHPLNPSHRARGLAEKRALLQEGIGNK
jgi:hypothetical protein